MLLHPIIFKNLPNNWNLLRKMSHGRNGRNQRKKSYVNIEEVTKKGTVSDLVNRISKMREKFVTHSEIKQNQSKAFKGNLEPTKIDSPVAVLQVDWAENFKCFTQNETQAAHFGQHQVSIFTAALWHQQQLKTFAIVSDSLDYTKTSAVANTIKILEILPAIVKLVYIHSDNATSQFKNKYTMASIIPLENTHDKNRF